MGLNKDISLNSKKIHLMGIGGAGMSGLAILLNQIGAEVSGCDLFDTSYMRMLKKKNIAIEMEHNASHVDLYNPDILVYSSAIPKNHPEIQKALSCGAYVARRAEVLSLIFNSKRGVGVAGTHGKTTTSSMISLAAEMAGLVPTIAIGGELTDIGTNAKLGQGEFMVAELDESDSSFTFFNPEIAVITNVDWDHRDHYKTFESVMDAFYEFLSKRKSGGKTILCMEDDGIQAMCERYDMHNDIVTYGWGTGWDWGASGVTHNHGGGVSYDLTKNGIVIARMRLAVSGEHNVLNSLAACAAAHEMGMSVEDMQKALAVFSGAKRRLQKTGEVDDILIYDDYGHHPNEIRATLSTVRKIYPERRLLAIFQPHRFTRTEALYKEFAEAMLLSDFSFILPIYGSDEAPIEGVSSKLIFDAISDGNKEHCVLSPDFDALVKSVCATAECGDIILTVGAGSVGALGKKIFDTLKDKRVSHAVV